MADGLIIVNDGCPKDVQVIKKGDTANCDGFLFSPDTEKQAEIDRDDAVEYKAISTKLEEKIKLQADENSVLEQRLKLYMDETHTLSQDVVKRDSNETFVRLGYFLLGVVATGLVIRNVRP